jgi:hypothetical protein
VLASLAAFGVVGIAAARLGVGELPAAWRIALAAAGMLPLMLADLSAMTRSTYCPISWRRQTPRSLVRRHHMFVVATLWGLDTGLVVTTFRVAAVTWAALLLAALGLAPWWVGIAYGVSFIVPFTALLVRPQLGRAARSEAPTDPGLETMLRMRSRVQRLSAVVLGGTAVLFALQLILSASVAP